MRGVSLHWFRDLFQEQAVGDIWGSFRRSLTARPDGHGHHRRRLGHGRAGLPRRFPGSTVLFYLSSGQPGDPVDPVSLGIGLCSTAGIGNVHWSTSAFGAQLTWTLPFGLLIMFAVFNRFDPAYEEAARDQGLRTWQVFAMSSCR
jgi:putative spermidine/putrescine transport system permease protein